MAAKAAQLAAKVTKPLSRSRLSALRAECDATPLTDPSRIDVDNLNSEQALVAIRALKPRAVFVASTGMLRAPLRQTTNTGTSARNASTCSGTVPRAT